jgi:phosphotransferase system HPr (HPr) family protein
MAVGIVVVSHSAPLAEAAVELAMQMVHVDRPPVALAAGADGGLGTDATAVATAIAEVDRGDGVAILVDLGSALMSAELGIELYGQPDTDVRILPAPFVEGLILAVIQASVPASPEVASDAEALAEAVVVNANGLHPRPAALLVAEARKFDADVKVRCRGIGPVSAKSSVGLASLQAQKGDTLRLSATGPEAEQAVEALAQFVSSGFGE